MPKPPDPEPEPDPELALWKELVNELRYEMEFHLHAQDACDIEIHEVVKNRIDELLAVKNLSLGE